jgi:hypothetical protein
MSSKLSVVLTLLVSLSFAGYSQDVFRRHGRKHTINVADPVMECVTWTYPGGRDTIVQFYGARAGDLLIREDGLTGTLKVKNDTIISGRIVLRFPSGDIARIDSLRPSASFNSYLGHYGGYKMSSWFYHPDHIAAEARYYDSRGRDSLMLKWNECGVLKSRSWNGTTSEFSEHGTLISERRADSSFSAQYYSGGVLKQLAKDSLIEDRILRYNAVYAPSGTLRSESWNIDNEPCCTWRTYDEHGKLLKTEAHRELTSFPPPVNIFEPPTDEIIIVIDSWPKYWDGENALKHRLADSLKEILTDSRGRVRGTYNIRFRTETDGQPVFIASDAASAELNGEIAKMIESLPKWSSFRYCSRRGAVEWSIAISVR